MVIYISFITFSHIKVLEPDQTFKIIWDICVVIVVLSNIFYIPFKIAFSPGYNELLSYAFETLPSLILILEIFFNFNTAFYDEGLIITNRKNICLNYISENFLLDLLIVIPFMIS